MKTPYFLRSNPACLVLSFCLSFFFTTNSIAATTNQPPATCTTGADCQSGGYGVNHLQPANTTDPYALFYQTPDAAFNQNIGSFIYSILDPTLAAPALAAFNVVNSLGVTKLTFNHLADFTNQDLTRLLSDTPGSAAMNLQSMVQVKAPLAISATQMSLANLPGTTTTQIPYSKTPDSVNVNSLLLPLQYNPSQQQNAWNFIQYLSGMANHEPTLDLSRLNNKDLAIAFTSNNDFQHYMLALRDQVSQQSIGLSNLYYLYASRIPQATTSYAQMLPELAKIPALFPSASPAQIENYLATRRYKDPNWTSLIQTSANPAELQRQTIYLLRDMLYEQYQRKLIDERILTTLSAMQFAEADTQKAQITALYNKLIKEPPFNGVHSSP